MANRDDERSDEAGRGGDRRAEGQQGPGGWLDGPGGQRIAGEYPGALLGLPREGPGSLGRLGRRVLGAVVDWTLCNLVVMGVFGLAYLELASRPLLVPAVFALENLLLVSTLGATIGHRVVGLEVVSVTRPTLTPLQVLLRTLLLVLFIPAVIWDRDGRGLHDTAAGTAIIRR